MIFVHAEKLIGFSGLLWFCLVLEFHQALWISPLISILTNVEFPLKEEEEKEEGEKLGCIFKNKWLAFDKI